MTEETLTSRKKGRNGRAGRALDEGGVSILDMAGDPRGLARLRRRVRRAQRLAHPRLCRIVEVAREGSALRVLTELPEGARPLAARLARGPLTVAETRRLAAHVCGAMAAAHASDVGHGRLSVASVVEAEDGYRVADLGPAQARSTAAADPRTDVRALGALLYEALTGAPPFEAPALSLPQELRAQVLRCLQLDPARRYAGMAEAARALGAWREGDASVRPKGRRAWRLLAALLVLGALAGGGVVGWRWWHERQAHRRAPVAVSDPRASNGPPARVPLSGVSASAPAQEPAAASAQAQAPAPAPAPAVETRKRPLVVLGDFSSGAAPGARWSARAAAELLALVLDEDGGFEVLRPPVDPAVLSERAKQGGVALTLAGTVEAQGARLTVSVRLYDVGASAYAFAERATAARPDELALKLDGIAGKIRRAAGATPRPLPPLAELASGNPAALRAWAEGLEALDAGDAAAAEKGLREAATADPRFFQPRARLAELLRQSGRTDEADAVAAEARPLAAHAGEGARLTLKRLEARTPAERIDALLALRARYPRDARLAAALAASYRQAGRAAECVGEGERALAQGDASAGEDLVFCRLETGDGEGALAAARRLPGPRGLILAGDVALMQGQYGDAREAYRRAGEKGARVASRWMLAALWSQGKCNQVLHNGAGEDDARAWGAATLLCGDWPTLRDAVDYAKRAAGARVAEDLALYGAAARGDKGTFGRARSRAADGSQWTAEGTDRARRYGPLLAAARAEGKTADALAGLSSSPIDRFGLFEPPLLFEVALAKIDVGDAEDGLLACGELAQAAPGWAPAHYCLGRAAEAQKDWAGAFREYREFLDRWSDADADNRWVRDARRRIVEVVKKAQAPKP